MKLIFLYGLPAAGKLTVGKELAELTGYKLFHNHLVVDTLLNVFDFGSPAFVELREQIWLSVFDQACRAHLRGLIFTFAPERTVRAAFIQQTVDLIASHHGEIVFVELVCPLPDLIARIDSVSRVQHRKLTSVSLFEQLHGEGVFDPFPMPAPSLTIDTSLCTPLRAAQQIASHALTTPRVAS